MRGRQRFGWSILGAAFAAVAFPPESSGIVMRHDVPEQRFLDLASRFPAAVSVHPGDALGAEGTLIAPQWVLTAAHVAAELGATGQVDAGGRTYDIERVVIHPDWQGMTRASLPYDIALLRLKLPVTGIEPALLFEGQEQEGAIVTFVGRGASGTGLSGPEHENRQSRAATNRLDKVDGGFLQFRFDNPTDAAVTELEGISGPGDSGGAAFQEIDGKLYVIGVSSWQDARPTGRKQGLYGVIEHYARVAHHHVWLTRTMAEAP